MTATKCESSMEHHHRLCDIVFKIKAALVEWQRGLKYLLLFAIFAVAGSIKFRL